MCCWAPVEPDAGLVHRARSQVRPGNEAPAGGDPGRGGGGRAVRSAQPAGHRAVGRQPGRRSALARGVHDPPRPVQRPHGRYMRRTIKALQAPAWIDFPNADPLLPRHLHGHNAAVAGQAGVQVVQ